MQIVATDKSLGVTSITLQESEIGKKLVVVETAGEKLFLLTLSDDTNAESLLLDTQEIFIVSAEQGDVLTLDSLKQKLEQKYTSLEVVDPKEYTTGYNITVKTGKVLSKANVLLVSKEQGYVVVKGDSKFSLIQVHAIADNPKSVAVESFCSLLNYKKALTGVLDLPRVIKACKQWGVQIELFTEVESYE